MKPYKLTIHCITYNHEKFIRQTLDSFVMQKTNFPFIAIISDDCSTDGTRKIIKEFEAKYPNIIKGIYHEKNIGVMENFISTSEQVNTPYVAMCEGDDYWTDPYKLQKQVDFLDDNPDCAISFHPVCIKWENSNKADELFPNKRISKNKTIFEFNDLLKINFIQTNSVVYRWRFNDSNIREFLPANIIPGDYMLHLLHAEKGKIGIINEVMSVYRKHDNGIWAGEGQSDKWFLNCGIRNLNFLTTLEKRYKYDCITDLKFLGKKTLLVLLKNHKFDDIANFAENQSELYDIILNELNKLDTLEPNLELSWGERFFSIKNNKEKTHKIITIAGIRIKFQKKKKYN